LSQQHTIKNSISCSGVGLHSGASISLTLKPAEANTGIVFVRTDLRASSEECRVPARWDMVSDTTMCTTLSNEAGVKVATVEHLMAALAGCGVDNLLVELDGPEVPIMDGSAAPFVFLVECAGLRPQDAARRAIRVLKQVEVWGEDNRIALLPSDGFSVSFEIDFETAAIENNDGFFDLHNGGFKREICRARTFGFESDVQRLMDLGLARGGSLDNAVVIGNNDEILNEGGLRYGDEFVRHKVLDCVGDLYLSGGPMLCHMVGFRSGHTLNNQLLRKLFADKDAWEFCEVMPKPSVEPSVTWREASPDIGTRPLAATA
jgi:UDP-3-O-[3-hydroxymyristoyl] N-acetylglucosamine deacetylase